MNVAFDPWIPVVTAAGKPQMASLCTVLAEGKQFADLAVRPHERVALMRLFLCVAHAALDGPRNYAEWCRVPQMLPGAIQKYLADWQDSFELFHPEKPWLQVAKLKCTDSGKTSPVALLDFEMATGNNSTLHDHGGQARFRQITPERMALNLVTFQNFSSGGGAPVAQWETIKTGQVGNPDAPCLSQSMVHCLLRGQNLHETIHLNLPTYERIGVVYREFSTVKKEKEAKFTEVPFGRPVWEQFPNSPQDYASIENATRTYIGRLVPISRWIRFHADTDQMICCNGFKYNTYKDGFPAEPTAAVRLITKKDKKGIESVERRVVSASPNRSTWRELSALLTKRETEGLGGSLAMENAPYDAAYDFQFCAMTRDQASMDIALESVFHITPSFQANLPIYQTEVIYAERQSRKLRWSIEEYRTAVDNDWRPRVQRTQPKEQNALKDRLAQTAFLSYWTAVEKNLPLLLAHIEAIGTDAAIPTREAWQKMLFRNACTAYRVACGQETPRQVRAFAKGWQKLTARRDEPESESNETKEVSDEPTS
ncbi:MAG: type I-E CRISPR-associated protein Cse1/CasA [Deltaproteobacteria bacterium]|nr:type I-E CRISPR-associated protein Cse1/CasA [Deltaproteobacteria bacterium]